MSNVEIKDKEFNLLVNYMRENYGLNLSKKRTLIEGRLGLVLKKKGFDSFESFVDFALNDQTGEAVNLLLTKLTTNYTYFGREQDHYDFLKDNILPNMKQNLSDRDLRIWSAGCSSGEEAYTLAITIDKYFGTEKANWDTTILATDVSTSVLKKARKGLYNISSLDRLSSGDLEKYFTKVDEDNYEVKDFLKDEIIFRYMNLMAPEFPLKRKIHVIFCRNVMIYFDKEKKSALINKFYDVLDNNGYLIIGHSESLNGIESDFRYIKPSIYKKCK